MMAKTKKKLNTTLLIANLPKDMAEILTAYKKRHGIKVNTAATIRMVREHPELEATIKKLRDQIQELEHVLYHIRQMDLHKENVKDHQEKIRALMKERFP